MRHDVWGACLASSATDCCSQLQIAGVIAANDSLTTVPLPLSSLPGFTFHPTVAFSQQPWHKAPLLFHTKYYYLMIKAVLFQFETQTVSLVAGGWCSTGATEWRSGKIICKTDPPIVVQR